MDSIFGFDFNGDGRKDFLDDLLFVAMMEEEQKRFDKYDYTDEDGEGDDF